MIDNINQMELQGEKLGRTDSKVLGYSAVMGIVEQIAQAIARVESGNFNPNSIAMRNNNPGNLRTWGSYPVENGYVKFPDYATGMAALQSQVQRNIDRGLNLYEFFGGKSGVYPGYAPAADSNNPRSYAETVANWLGISPAMTLSMAAVPPISAPTSGSSSPVFFLPSILDGADQVGGVSPAVVAALAIGGVALLWWALA